MLKESIGLDDLPIPEISKKVFSELSAMVESYCAMMALKLIFSMLPKSNVEDYCREILSFTNDLGSDLMSSMQASMIESGASLGSREMAAKAIQHGIDVLVVELTKAIQP